MALRCGRLPMGYETATDKHNRGKLTESPEVGRWLPAPRAAQHAVQADETWDRCALWTVAARASRRGRSLHGLARWPRSSGTAMRRARRTPGLRQTLLASADVPA